MNYEMTDDELRMVESVREQFELVSGLLSLKDGDLAVITTRNLYVFIDARIRELDGLVEAMYDRRAAQFDRQVMSWDDWMHALRIARGDALRSPSGIEARISGNLAAAAQTCPDAQRTLDEWMRVLVSEAEEQPA